ncbi:MAG: hypothetical protein ABIE74_02660 [Pseudomonadota bacterium]
MKGQILPRGEKRLFSMLRTAVSASPFASLVTHLGGKDSPQPTYESATSALNNLADGIAMQSPGLGYYLMNHAVLTDLDADRGTLQDLRFESFIDVISQNEQLPILSTAVMLPDVFKNLLLEINRTSTQMNVLIGGLNLLGIPHPEKIVRYFGIDEESRIPCSVILKKNKRNCFDISIDHSIDSNSIDIDVAIPDCVQKISREYLLKVISRAFAYGAVQRFVTHDINASLRSFSKKNVGQLPAYLLLASGLDYFKDLIIYPKGFVKDPVQMEDFYDLLSWLSLWSRACTILNRSEVFQKFIQTRDVHSEEWKGVFLSKKLRGRPVYSVMPDQELLDRLGEIKMHPLYDPYFKSLLLHKEVMASIFQPIRNLLSPPYGLTIGFTRSSDGIKVGRWSYDTSGPSYKAAGSAIKLSCNRRFLNQENFLRLFWRVSVLTRNSGSNVYYPAKGLSTVDDHILQQRMYSFSNEEPVSLTDLEDEIGLTSFEREDFRYLMLLFKHYKLVMSGAHKSGKILIDGNLHQASKQHFAIALKVIKANLLSNAGESTQVVWENVLKGQAWLLGEGDEDRDPVIVEITPSENSTIVFVRGDSTKITRLDWLFLLSAVAANGNRPIRLAFGKNREIIFGTSVQLVKDLYDAIASNSLNSPYQLHDPAAKRPENIDLELPGAVPVRMNPNYASATLDVKKEYIRALRWFSMSDVPLKWQPWADDSLATVRKKFRDMSKECHSDRGADEGLVALLRDSNQHWAVVLDMHGEKIVSKGS